MPSEFIFFRSFSALKACQIEEFRGETPVFVAFQASWSSFLPSFASGRPINASKEMAGDDPEKASSRRQSRVEEPVPSPSPKAQFHTSKHLETLTLRPFQLRFAWFCTRSRVVRGSNGVRPWSGSDEAEVSGSLPLRKGSPQAASPTVATTRPDSDGGEARGMGRSPLFKPIYIHLLIFTISYT